MYLILNLTTQQYFEYDETKNYKEIMKQLLKPLTKDEALIKEDIGESHWRREDKIVFVPQNLNKFVEKKYNKLFI